MKKFLFSFLILLFILIGLPFGAAQASTKAAVKSKTTKVLKAQKASAVVWSASALRELKKIPRFVRGTVKAKITNYAIKHKIKTITGALVKSIKV
jgi:hypothetical protein